MNKTFKGQFDTVVFMRDGKEYVVIIQEGLVYTRTKELFTGAITCELQANVIEGKFEGKWVQYYTEEEILTIFPELESFNEKRILVETFYKDGKKNGQWLQYHADGKLHIKTHYKDDKVLFHKKKKLNLKFNQINFFKWTISLAYNESYYFMPNIFCSSTIF